MSVRVPERVLRRFAERFDQPKLEFPAGGGVRVGLGQQRSAHDGGGVAWLRLVGSPEGADLRFDFPLGATVEGAVGPAEVRELTAAGERLVEVFSRLCKCARLPEDCDCCQDCDGEGVAGEGAGRAPCWTCAGLGYDEEAAVGAGFAPC